jgi:antirestriction protein ArdC
MLPFAIWEDTMNVYEIVNLKIMEMLEQGTVPWRKPWRNAETNMPKNLVSGKEYKGVNTFLLGCQSYGSPWWLSFKQCQEKGGHVRKGERSSLVVYWKWLDRKSGEGAEDADGNGASNGKIPLLRYYNVFNLEQTEGIPEPPKQETNNIFTPIEKAQAIIDKMPLRPEIRHGGSRAAYSPMLDYIKMPEKHTFNSSEEYFSTCYHELSHSTGHEKRLNRKSLTEITGFGDHSYQKEELTAEMSAAFLCAYADIEQVTLGNSAAYIAGWLKALKNDKTMLVFAASQGQKAADYILNKQEDHIELDEAA